MPIQMIAADLDNTLLRNDKRLSAFTAATLCTCRTAGIRVVLATARTEGYCQEVIRAVRPDAVISNGGSLARAGEMILFDRPIPAAEADALIADILCCPSYRQMTAQTVRSHYASAPHGSAAACDFSVPLHEAAYKITPELTDPADADRLRALHPACEAVRFTGEDWYRFVAAGCGKWPALQAVTAHFGIHPTAIAAFGDDVLDDGMLRHCGFGVAVANASPSTGAAAAFHCGSNEEDGPAHWLREQLPRLFR